MDQVRQLFLLSACETTSLHTHAPASAVLLRVEPLQLVVRRAVDLWAHTNPSTMSVNTGPPHASSALSPYVDKAGGVGWQADDQPVVALHTAHGDLLHNGAVGELGLSADESEDG